MLASHFLVDSVCAINKRVKGIRLLLFYRHNERWIR